MSEGERQRTKRWNEDGGDEIRLKKDMDKPSTGAKQLCRKWKGLMRKREGGN